MYYSGNRDIYEDIASTYMATYRSLKNCIEVTILCEDCVGEADAELLFMTTTNPKLRKLLRFTIDDDKEFKRVLELLHGKSENMREQRRNMLRDSEFSYADIDN